MYLLIDIGKTKTRIAGSENLEKFSEPRISDTPKTFSEGISLLKRTADELCSGKKIKAAACGIGGLLDRAKTMSLNSSGNIADWFQKPLKAELEKVFNAPVFLENDCVFVSLGEAVYGAGRGYKIVAYITVSTGVGGARIVNGKIDENALGFEPGHQIINFDGQPERLESYISGMAFEKKYGKKPYEITDEKIWDETAKILAYGLNNTIVHWSPDIVVLGGSMMKKIGIPIERARFHLKNILKIFPELPLIEKASLGDIGGLYGALTFLKKRLE